MAKSRTKAENNNKGLVVTLLLDSSFWKLEWSLIALNDFFITHLQNPTDVNRSIHWMRQLCMWGYESKETSCCTVGNEAIAWRWEKAAAAVELMVAAGSLEMREKELRWARKEKLCNEGERKEPDAWTLSAFVAYVMCSLHQ